LIRPDARAASSLIAQIKAHYQAALAHHSIAPFVDKTDQLQVVLDFSHEK
jgi:hypothetical protein